METKETEVIKGDQPELPEKREVRIISGDSAELPLTYVNAIGIESSYMDFHFILANRFSDDNGTLIKELQRVVMSPQQAKTLFLLLKKHIRLYEEKYGHFSALDDNNDEDNE